MRRRLPWLAVLVVFAVALAVRHRYREYFYDDAWISFRYAERWITGHGLTWTDGERVEGYSDLLWVLACGGLAYLGVPWVGAAHLLGGLGFAAVVWGACVDPDDLRAPVLARTVIGGGLAALTGGLAIWAVAGLEHTLLAGLATLGALALVRACEGTSTAAPAALWFTLVVLTRPDGALLWAAALIGALASTDRRRWSALWPAGALPALAIGGQQVARVLYYGDWVPNTARAKVSLTWERTGYGLLWIGDALLHHAALYGVAALALPARRPRVAIPLAMAVSWTGYVAWIGGDFMAGWRMLVPAFGPLALLASEAAARRGRPLLLAAGPLLALHAVGANSGKWIDKAFDMHGWVIAEPIGRALRRAFAPYDPLLAVDAAGGIPFYTRFRALDMLGLTDRWLATHPPPSFGGMAIGHDLGDGDYVWSRAPDLLLFNGANGSTKPRFASGEQLVRRPDFAEVYQSVNFRVPIDGRSFPVHLYVRRTDGPLAVQRVDGRIEVPAWFFSREDGAPAKLADGQVVTAITAERPGALVDLPVPRGVWLVTTDPPGPLEIGCDGDPIPTPSPAVVALPRNGTITVVARPESGEVALRGATLTETERSPTIWCP